MLSDYIEIKNIFDNPEEVVLFAKQQSFVAKEGHYHRNAYYNGVRTPSIEDLNKDVFEKIFGEIFNKIMHKRFINETVKTEYAYGYTLTSYFHIMSENDIYNENWLHKDDNALMAGVIYLNPNPRPNTGTIVYKDGKETIVDNEYNKLVLYNTDFLHGPQGGFGTDVNDSRLTLVFFITEFRMKIDTKEEYVEK